MGGERETERMCDTEREFADNTHFHLSSTPPVAEAEQCQTEVICLDLVQGSACHKITTEELATIIFS